MRTFVYVMRITSAITTFLFLFTRLSAQSGTINGYVKDGNGNPLQGASISVKEKKTGTTSDFNGHYILKLSPGDYTIIVSFVGRMQHQAHVTVRPDVATEQNFSVEELFEANNAVVVTGSRSKEARSKLTTPVPVDVIPVATITREIAQTDLNQMLTYVAPSFQSARQTIADGTDHIDPAQLRGLGSDQVLVLVNGKRRHQSALVNVNGTVNRGQVGTDLSAIPLVAIEKVEVLRDGAAAQYGSDAIAGVINIVLKKNFNSLSGNISYGENVTSYPKDFAFGKLNNVALKKTNVQDGGIFQAGLNYGLSLGKNGFINLSGEYSLRDKTNRAGTYTGQIFPLVNGVNKDDSILNARALTRNDFDMRIGNSKIASGAFFVNGEYALGTNWNLNVFAGYSHKNGEAAGFFRYPSSISSSAGSFTNQVFSLYPNGFLPLIKSNIIDYSASVGIEGKLGNWNASLSNTIGLNDFDFTVDNSINYTQYAVTSPPQTKFDAGGLRFLQNTVNADLTRNFNLLSGLNVAYGAEYRIDQYSQRAGEEASFKNFDTASKAASGSQVFAGFLPAYANTHSRNNVGLYFDLEQNFTKQWLLEFALRFENYSDFGSTLNYKLATRYKVSDNFTVRAATSTGFRAPSLQQKFYAKTNTLFVPSASGLVPTESGTFTNDSKPAEILGIPSLKEEISNNFSLGFTTTLVKGLEITVDGYLINIKNRIVLTNNFTGGTDAALAQQLKDNGASTANFFTNAIDTKSKGLEASISYHTSFAGANKLKFILAATFIKNEVEKGADGKPIIKASETLINSGQLGNYFNREDQSRFEVASPSSKGSFSVNYNHKKLGAMLRFVYFGEVQFLQGPPPQSDPFKPVITRNTFTGTDESTDQTFSAKTVTDLSLSYQLRKEFTITIGSNNLFDVYQDKHTHSDNVSLGRFIYSRRVQQMGFNGRFVFAKISFNVK